MLQTGAPSSVRALVVGGYSEADAARCLPPVAKQCLDLAGAQRPCQNLACLLRAARLAVQVSVHQMVQHFSSLCELDVCCVAHQDIHDLKQ